MSLVINPINTIRRAEPILTECFNALRNRDFWKNTTKAFQDEDTLQTFALVSTISKDAINCAYYVTQSMRNEKIPEDKRPFVASLDLSNGILNVSLQAAIGYWIKNNTGPFFDAKMAKNLFSDSVFDKMHKIIAPTMDPEFFKSKFMASKSIVRGGFGLVATLVGTQIITKRVIVPFIATPMASIFKKWFDASSKNKSANGDTVSINRTVVDSTTPATKISTQVSANATVENKDMPKVFKEKF